MTITVKLLVVLALAVGEILAVLVVAKRLPEAKRGPIVPVLALSSLAVVSLTAYLLFYFF